MKYLLELFCSLLVSQLNLLGELDNLLFISAVEGMLEAGTYFWKAEFELGFRLESSALLEDDFEPNNNSWNSKNIKKWVSQNLEFESRNLKIFTCICKAADWYGSYSWLWS